MDDFISTFLYLLLMLVIVLVGGLSRKKKQRGPAGKTAEKKTGASSAVMEALLKGTGLTDILADEETQIDEGTSPMDGQVFPESPVAMESSEVFSENMQKETTEPGDGVNDLIPGTEGAPVFEETAETLISDDRSDSEDLTSGAHDHLHNFWDTEDSVKNSFLYELLEDFDARKAVIYTEIMTPRYF